VPAKTTICARILILIALLLPFVAQANPVALDGQSLIAFAIVAFWALVIESGVATLTLCSTGVMILPMFGTLVIANIFVFLFGFLPLTSRVSLLLLEPSVVIADATLIKLIAAAPFLQGGSYEGVSWRRALTASFLGNVASYFIGVIGSHSPWIEPKSFGVE
jgi:hypothetical protein